jgi:hypothetical protein
MRTACIVFFGGWCQIAYVTVKITLVLQNCTDALRIEHGLCSATSVRSSDDSNEVTSIKIERKELCVKEEDEPIAVSSSSSSIKDEPEVSPQTFHQYLRLPPVIMLYCLSAFPYKAPPCGEWKWSVYIFTEYVKYRD